MVTNLIEVLRRAANTEGKGVIFISESEDEFLSYQDLYQESLKFLGHIQKLGLKDNDELIFQLEDNKTFLTAFWGCILGGIIPVPVKAGVNDEEKLKLFKIWDILKNPYLYTDNRVLDKLEIFANKFELEEKFQEIKKNTVLVTDEKLETIGKEIEFKPIKVGFIQFSSGSTGTPKGVVLSHENLVTNIRGISEGVGITHEDSSMGWMPLTHDMGLIMLHLTNIYSCIDQYIIPTNIFVRNPVLWIRKTNEYRTTLLSSPNFGYKHFLNFFKPEMGIGWDLSCIRLIYNGAEPISADLCDIFSKEMAKYGMKKNVIFPAYGLAEACVVMTLTTPSAPLAINYLDRKSLGIGQKIKPMEKNTIGGVSFVEVGTPIRGSDVRIADENNNVLSNDTVGHIQISGGNVMWGYYKNRKATEEVITEDGWCFTGDLGFIRNGKLTITGRAKDIMFVNGQNVYAHDIERIAEDIEGVELGMVAAVGIYNKEIEEEEIVLFVRFKKKIDHFMDIKLQLKKHINLQTGIRLKNIIPVKRMPKTTSGKIQRFKFKESYILGEYDDLIEKLYEKMDEIVAKTEKDKPQNRTQTELLHIWEDVLDSDKIGINDSFFDLDGDSLALLIMVGEIHKKFNVEIPVSEVFEHSTIVKLENLIESAIKRDYHAIVRTDDREYYPASPAQKRMYLLSQFKGGETVYNNPFLLRIDGELKIKEFIKSIKKIVKKNEVFRTGFEIIDGEVIQRIHDYETLDLNIEYTEESVVSMDLLTHEFIRAFDLSKPYLMRIKLVKILEDRYLLLFDIHHIITDGTSVNLFIKELNFHYNGIKIDKPQIQYRDFTMWQYEFFKKEEFKEQEKYWLNKFSGNLPVLNMPLDYSRGTAQNFNGNRINFRMDKNKVRKLKDIAKRSHTTLFMVMFTAYNALLHRYTGQDDIVVGTPVSGRNHSDVNNMHGVFINTLAIRTFPEAEKTFDIYLKEVKQTLIDAYENSEYPFEMLVENVNVKRELSRNPLFDTMFVYQNMKLNNFELEGTLFTKYEINRQISAFDFSMEIYEEGEELKLNFDYCTSLFERKSMERFVNQYQMFLNEISNNTDQKISEINIISEEEKFEILTNFNNTEMNYPKDKTIIELFEEQVEKTPDNTAVIHEDSKLTYRELNNRVNQLAWTLREKGIKADDIVPIITERSLEMIIGIYAILKAGGAYLPIDPNFPEDRIKYILEDSNAKLVLTKKYIDEKNHDFDKNIIYIENEEFYSANKENLPRINKPTDLVYVIYTSGSTGNPKGVMIENYSLINRIIWMQKEYPINQNDTILQKTNYTFDVSVWEIFWWSIYGAKVCLLSVGGEKEPKKITDTILKENVSVIHFVPSMFSLFLENEYLIENKDEITSLSNIFTSGEALPKKLSENFFKLQLKNAKLNNLYGPTEASIDVTYFNCIENYTRNSIPIGKPIDNIQMYVVDNEKNLCPIGVPGELCIAGDGLARGYLNRPDLTSEKFVENPFVPDTKMYKTGDLAKWMPDGNIEYLGRIDFQVKIRGYRIELGEIENKIMEISGIEGSVLKVIETSNSKMLAAYYTGKVKSNDEIRKVLLSQLPEYMVPMIYVHMKEFPLTHSGKTDRKALPDIDLNEHISETIGAKNEVEEKILAVWKEVLEIEEIGVENNFFEFGGDSLNAVRVASRLQVEFDVNISDIFEYPTVRELGQVISVKKENLKTKLNDIKKMMYEFEEAVNNFESNKLAQDEINHYKLEVSSYADKKLEFDKEYSKILLTGATGYFGVYLLKEILEITNSSVILPIRGIDSSDSERRLVKKLEFYFGSEFYPKYQNRIKIVQGDIRKPNLGIKTEDYNIIVQEVECVINSAADVRHYGKYEDFYQTNVQGVINALEFCSEGRKKDFFHISTMSVASGKLDAQSLKLFTENDIDMGQEISNYYIKTKLEAEKEIVKWREKGLNCNILRVGNIMFESETGKFQENISGNAFYKHIKSLLELNSIPAISYPTDFSFVDNLASAAILLTKNNLENEIYHLYNPHTICYNKKGEYLQELHPELQVRNIEEFCDDIYNAYSDESIRESAEELVMRFQNFDEYYQFMPVSDKTNLILSRQNFNWTIPTENEIGKMISYGKKKKFFK